jgi:Zn-dependent protease with chaperone function
MKRPIAALLLCLLCASLPLRAQNTPPKYWNVDQIISNAPLIRLKGDKGENLGMVNRLHLQMILDVRGRIEKQTRLRTDALVTQSQEPFAYVLRNPNSGRFGVVLSLGMIEALGQDWDACAALLAHEYAHVALNHNRDAKGVFSLEDEQGAEKFARQLVADAGYKTDGTLRLWQKLRAKNVVGPYLRMHPSTAERLEQLRQALEASK